MIATNSYQAKQFNLSGLNGISDQTLEMHFKLRGLRQRDEQANGKDFRVF